MMTGRRPTKAAPLLIWSLRIATRSAPAGSSQTAPPSSPSVRTRMSWSGAVNPAASSFCVSSAANCSACSFCWPAL